MAVGTRERAEGVWCRDGIPALLDGANVVLAAGLQKTQLWLAWENHRAVHAAVAPPAEEGAAGESGSVREAGEDCEREGTILPLRVDVVSAGDRGGAAEAGAQEETHGVDAGEGVALPDMSEQPDAFYSLVSHRGWLYALDSRGRVWWAAMDDEEAPAAIRRWVLVMPSERSTEP